MIPNPIILAIDTSCDETAAAVVWGRRILSNVIFSQVDIHAKYGGVYPALAKRAHVERIDGVITEALKRASITYKKTYSFSNAKCKMQNVKPQFKIQKYMTDSGQARMTGKQQMPTNANLVTTSDDLRLDAVAVTQGPGLAIALEVGIAKAKALATSTKFQASNPKQIQSTNDQNTKHNESDYIDSGFHRNDKEVDSGQARMTIKQPDSHNQLINQSTNQLPLIAVNHLEGHILSTIAQNSQGNPRREILFPALALIVSGGNTQMLLVHAIGNYELIGETLDDACGEALDKAARILKLGYPGGPIIERLALTGDRTKYLLRPALTDKKNLNFSYSGLKTAFLYLVNNLPESEFGANLNNLAASFQYHAFEQLQRKLTHAIVVYQPKSVLCGGGVLANRYLRYILNLSASKNHVPIYFPTNKLLYGDNAAMIGVAAYYKYLRGEFIKPEDLDRKPNWKLSSQSD